MANKKKGLGRYIDPRTDFGMKFYFGREENKQFLIDFLNGLFQEEKVIRDLRYAPTEHDGDTETERRVVFDLHCTGVDGEFFIIEVQQLYQEFFKDRAVYYTSRVISKQVAKGKKGNHYRLPEVYFIGILEFRLDAEEKERYFYDVALCDRRTNELFYDKLGYKLVVLPNFNKKETELEGYMDQWLYFLKNLSEMEEMSKFLDKRIFSRIFEVGEIAKLNKEELMAYQASIKQKMDAESIFSSARRAGRQEGRREGLEEGREEGRKEGRKEGRREGRKEGHAEGEQEAKKAFVRNLLLKGGVSVEDIAELAIVPLAFVQKIHQEILRDDKKK